MAAENETAKIIRKTGRKPVQCKCLGCKSQCAKVPCLGTPTDILKLIEAGHRERIFPTDWWAGMAMGSFDRPIPMYQLENTPTGCVLFKEGLCTIHHSGLKPTEGKLSHHSHKPETFNKHKSLSLHVAKTWLDPDNKDVIAKIDKYFI
jgi:hypothetical protein